MNAMTRLSTAAAIALLTLTLAGCASTSKAPVLLTLPPVATAVAADGPSSDRANVAGTGPVGAAAGTSRPAALPVLVLRRVDVPEYLVSRRVRYRADASTLAEWPDTFWAERIEVGVSREFASALRQRLPAWRLCESQCGDQTPALSLQVELVQMDYLRSARLLCARAQLIVWTGGNAPRLLRSERRSYEIAAAADTPQAHAQALAELIVRVAEDTAPLITSAGASANAAP